MSAILTRSVQLVLIEGCGAHVQDTGFLFLSNGASVLLTEDFNAACMRDKISAMLTSIAWASKGSNLHSNFDFKEDLNEEAVAALGKLVQKNSCYHDVAVEMGAVTMLERIPWIFARSCPNLDG